MEVGIVLRFTMDVFVFMANNFMRKIKKKVVPKVISRLLSLRSIGYWFCDAGLVNTREHSPSIRFCTDSFSKRDVFRLSAALRDVYSVPAKMYQTGPNHYRIYVEVGESSMSNSEEFRKKIVPFIIPEMHSKIPDKWLE